MELFEFQRLGLQRGDITEDDIVAYDKNSVILTFTKSDDSAIAESEYLGKKVYPESLEINCPGTWICQLKSFKGFYKAKAIRHLDASFFLALKESQKKEIADILWSENHDAILPYFEEKYGAEVQAKLSVAVSESVKSLQAEIDVINADRESLSQELEKCRLLLSNKISELSSVADSEKHDQLNTVPLVRRTSGDTIHCDLFTNPQYFVHISMDRKKMFIQPHRSGKTICLNGTLYLSNFSNLVPFDGACDLKSEFIPEKGFYVYFD